MRLSDMAAIRPARFPDDLEQVRLIFREYADSLDVDLCFQGFESELAGLPGMYAEPKGRLLLAEDEGEVVGCVAMRPLEGAVCEMKRLYVRPEARGLRLGRLLAERLLAQARGIGYRRICLDTLPTMLSAQRLYESLGFEPIAPYVHNPVPGAKFLGLNLRS